MVYNRSFSEINMNVWSIFVTLKFRLYYTIAAHQFYITGDVKIDTVGIELNHTGCELEPQDWSLSLESNRNKVSPRGFRMVFWQDEEELMHWDWSTLATNPKHQSQVCLWNSPFLLSIHDESYTTMMTTRLKKNILLSFVVMSYQEAQSKCCCAVTLGFWMRGTTVLLTCEDLNNLVKSAILDDDDLVTDSQCSGQLTFISTCFMKVRSRQ